MSSALARMLCTDDCRLVSDWRSRYLQSVFWIVLCAFLPVATVPAQDEPPANYPPIDNSEFFGVKNLAKVTRRFEIYDPHSGDELAAVKAMGFDQVILDRAPLHTEATQLGLDVVIANWWTDQTEKSAIEQSLEFSKQVEPGRLAGISIMDEPERNSPDTPFDFYVKLYQELKPKMIEELADVRLEISYWGPLVNWDQRHYEYFSYLYESADVMRLMPYPDLHEDPLGDVYLMLQRSKRAMRLAHVDIPQLVILQTWVLPPKNELPTIDELRVMAYQAMLGGAETLSFFEYKPELWSRTPGFEQEFIELMKELRGLSARLAEATIESVLSANGILDATVVWPSGGTAAIRVNTNRYVEDGLEALQIDDTSVVGSRALVPSVVASSPRYGVCRPTAASCVMRPEAEATCAAARMRVWSTQNRRRSFGAFRR